MKATPLLLSIESERVKVKPRGRAGSQQTFRKPPSSSHLLGLRHEFLFLSFIWTFMIEQFIPASHLKRIGDLLVLRLGHEGLVRSLCCPSSCRGCCHRTGRSSRHRAAFTGWTSAGRSFFFSELLLLSVSLL